MAVLRNLYPPSQEQEWDDEPTVGEVKYGSWPEDILNYNIGCY